MMMTMMVVLATTTTTTKLQQRRKKIIPEKNMEIRKYFQIKYFATQRKQSKNKN